MDDLLSKLGVVQWKEGEKVGRPVGGEKVHGLSLVDGDESRGRNTSTSSLQLHAYR